MSDLTQDAALAKAHDAWLEPPLEESCKDCEGSGLIWIKVAGIKWWRKCLNCEADISDEGWKEFIGGNLSVPTGGTFRAEGD